MVNELANNHNISLIYFEYPKHEIEVNKEVNVLYKVKLSRLRRLTNFLQYPFLHPFFTSRFNISLLRRLKLIVNEYDVIYFDFSQTFVYSYFIEHSCKYLMAHDIIYQKYDRLKGILNFFQKKFIKYSEEKLLSGNSKILCFSKKDQTLLKEGFNRDSLKVDFYVDRCINQQNTNDTISENEPFVFFGAWNRHENTDGLDWFLKEVYPFVNREATFVVIGAGMPKLLLEKINSLKNFHYLGFVENPYEYILKSKALIAPIFNGAGVKVKVLDSLASGTPVLGTEVAFEGIEIANVNEGLVLCSSSIDFIEKINQFESWSAEKRNRFKRLFHNSYPRNKFIELI